MRPIQIETSGEAGAYLQSLVTRELARIADLRDDESIQYAAALHEIREATDRAVRHAR